MLGLAAAEACSGLPIDEVRYACTSDETCGEGWVCRRGVGSMEGVCSVSSTIDADVSAVGDGQAGPTSDAGDLDGSSIGGDAAGLDTSDARGDVTPCSAGGCDDGDPCTDDSCGIAAVCIHVFVVGPACEDGDACSVGDTCGLLGCQPGAPSKCDDGDPCTGDSCLPDKGCQFTPILGCR